jgi:hypothetical protein
MVCTLKISLQVVYYGLRRASKQEDRAPIVYDSNYVRGLRWTPHVCEWSALAKAALLGWRGNSESLVLRGESCRGPLRGSPHPKPHGEGHSLLGLSCAPCQIRRI